MKSNFSKAISALRRGDTPFYTYLLFAATYLGAQMFQGLSYLDIGFYMSGYQHFCDEPIATYYLGQWLMTFVTTTFIGKALGVSSYLGLRVMLLVLLIALQTVIYFYLKRYIRRRYIILGLLLATLANFGSYTEINYNDYSIGLLTLTVLAYHHGATRQRPWFVLIGGMLVGAALFFRITNLSFIGLPFAALLVFHKSRHVMPAARQLAWFFGSITAGCAVTVLIINAVGLTSVLLMTINDIFSISKDTGDPHSLLDIAFNWYKIFKEELKGGAVMAVITALAVLTLVNDSRFKRPLLLLLSLITIINIYYWEPSANITVGICLVAATIVLLDKDVDEGMKSLFLMSLYIPLIFPLGSNAIVDFCGKGACFLSLPLAASIIGNGRRLLRHNIRGAYTKALAVVCTAVCVAFVITNITRDMMEEGDRLACRYEIDSPLARGILTTKENADMHNRLIKTLSPLIPKQSYMICDFSIPLIGMLECKPYAVFSTYFTSNSMNRRYIQTAYRHTGGVPYLLSDKQKGFDKDRYVEQCLRRITPYRIIWQDERFVLKAPVYKNGKAI